MSKLSKLQILRTFSANHWKQPEPFTHLPIFPFKAPKLYQLFFLMRKNCVKNEILIIKTELISNELNQEEQRIDDPIPFYSK